MKQHDELMQNQASEAENQNSDQKIGDNNQSHDEELNQDTDMQNLETENTDGEYNTKKEEKFDQISEKPQNPITLDQKMTIQKE